MFKPAEMRERILALCKEREARGEIVFTLVRQNDIRSIPQGTAFIVPSYTLCPGRPLPDVQAVSTEPVLIATEHSEEYIILTTYGDYELIFDGLEGWADPNYAYTMARHDAGEIDECYVLTMPWLKLEITDADKPVSSPAKAEPVRKLEFL